jgi:hypothetical protein
MTKAEAKQKICHRAIGRETSAGKCVASECMRWMGEYGGCADNVIALPNSDVLMLPSSGSSNGQ